MQKQSVPLFARGESTEESKAAADAGVAEDEILVASSCPKRTAHLPRSAAEGDFLRKYVDTQLPLPSTDGGASASVCESEEVLTSQAGDGVFFGAVKSISCLHGGFGFKGGISVEPWRQLRRGDNRAGPLLIPSEGGEDYSSRVNSPVSVEEDL